MTFSAAQFETDDIRDYLLAHPDFFAENCDVLTEIVPPKRNVSREGAEDFQHYMLTRLQEHVSAIQGEHNDLLELMQEHLQRQNRINNAILSLLDAEGFEATISCIANELPSLLDQEAVSLFFEAGEAFPHGHYGYAEVVPEGFVDQWLSKNNDVLLREADKACSVLFPEFFLKVQSYALVRLNIDEGVPPGMLALGHRDSMYYATGLATEQIESLGGVAERCIRRWLHSPS